MIRARTALVAGALLAGALAAAGTPRAGAVAGADPAGADPVVPVFDVTTWAAGATPTSISTADLDGDGTTDLLLVDAAGNLTVLPGDPDSGFLTRYTYPVGGVPTSTLPAQLRVGGPMEVAVSTGDTLVIMTNAGSGVLVPGLVVNVGRAPSSIAGGDIDGDGDLDLLTSNAGSDNVSVLLSDGVGGYSSPLSLPVGDAPDGLDLGDFDRDGDLDVAVSNAGSDSVTILLGHGDGTFDAGAQAYATGGSDPTSVMVTDIDDDTLPDLVMTNGGSDNLAVLRGNGDGTFEPARTTPTSTPVTAGQQPVAAVADDLNGDGHLDIATLNAQSATISVFLGAGDGSLTPATGVIVGPAPVWLVSADFDSDGRPDLATASASTSTVWVWRNDTVFPMGRPVPPPPGAPSSSACGHRARLVGHLRSTGYRSEWSMRYRQGTGPWRQTPRREVGPDDDVITVVARVRHLRPAAYLAHRVVVRSQGEVRTGPVTRTWVRPRCPSAG